MIRVMIVFKNQSAVIRSVENMESILCNLVYDDPNNIFSITLLSELEDEV